MKESNTSKHLNDEIDLKDIFSILLKGKWNIVLTTSFISIAALIYSLFLPNIYESKAILVPVNSSSDISRALGGYSSFAGLAGISLPTNVDEGNAEKAIKKIGSLSFFEESIYNNIFLPDLFAVKSWSYKTNSINYNKNIYHNQSNTWTRDFSHPQQQIPSAQESFDIFYKENLSLNQDQKSGFITLSIRHQSPYIAKEWAELVINQINSFYRQKDKLESEKAKNYLNEQISRTSLSEIKEVLAQLMQEEVKKLTLIEANQYYVFDFIDPPAIMEKKSGPKRLLIIILSILLGGILGILLVFLRYYIDLKQDK